MKILKCSFEMSFFDTIPELFRDSSVVPIYFGSPNGIVNQQHLFEGNLVMFCLWGGFVGALWQAVPLLKHDSKMIKFWKCVQCFSASISIYLKQWPFLGRKWLIWRKNRQIDWFIFVILRMSTFVHLLDRLWMILAEKQAYMWSKAWAMVIHRTMFKMPDCIPNKKYKERTVYKKI